MNNLIETLRNIDPNDPGRWPLAIRAGAVLVVLIAASVLSFVYLAWKAERPALEKARAEEGRLLTELETKAKKAANLEQYKAQLAEMEQSFGAMLRQLPNRTEVPSLLVDISQKGLEAGLEQTLFQPASPVQHDFYAELPIRIRMTGDFHSIGNFVSGVAALPRIVTLHDINVSRPGRQSTSGTLQFEVTAKTYRYLDDEETAAKAPPARQPARQPARRK
jgi:type IV pilus assembly protein PilO